MKIEIFNFYGRIIFEPKLLKLDYSNVDNRRDGSRRFFREKKNRYL